MRIIVQALTVFAMAGFAYSGVFAAVALWPFGWHHSANAIATAVLTIAWLWRGFP